MMMVIMMLVIIIMILSASTKSGLEEGELFLLLHDAGCER